MNTELKAAYEKLNNEHPDLFKGCPIELPGNYREIKNSVARKFDLGPDLTDCYLAREVNTWIVDSDENNPEYVSEVLLADIQRQEEYDLEKNRERCVSSNQFVEYEGSHRTVEIDGHIEKRELGYGLGLGCSTLVDLRSQVEYQCWVGTYPIIDSTGFKVIKLGNGLKTQIKEFGKKIFIPVGRKGQSKKYEKKDQALVNALSRAFAPRNMRPSEGSIKTLHLDTCSASEDCGQGWTPVTSNPLDEMIDEEQRELQVTKARQELAKIRDELGADKWVLLMESLQKTAVQIAEEINANGGDTNAAAIRKRLSRVRKALAQLGSHV